MASSAHGITELRRVRALPTLFPESVSRLGALVHHYQTGGTDAFAPAALALVAELLAADAVAWTQPAHGVWEVAQLHLSSETTLDAEAVRDLCRAYAVLTQHQADDILQITVAQHDAGLSSDASTDTAVRASVGVCVRCADGTPAGRPHRTLPSTARTPRRNDGVAPAGRAEPSSRGWG